MKYRFILSLFILALASALVGGATLAFFTSEDTPEPHFFTTGTVEITGLDVVVENIQAQMLDGGGEDLITIDCIPGYPPGCPVPPPECNDREKTITWCVENTGTKKAYIRVKPPVGAAGEDGSAIGAGQYFGDLWKYQYLTYEWCRFIPIVTELVTGAKLKHAGYVIIWRDWNYFYVIYITDSGWSLEDTKVYAETVKPTKDNAKALGHYRFKHENLNRTSWDIHMIPLEDVYKGKKKCDVYFITHADIIKGGSTWTLHPDSSSSWLPGSGGWYYYKDPVDPGDKVCIKFNVTKLDPDKEYTLTAEAVQASHNAHKAVWKGNPLP
jgi:predicted ribosomally synthesized peptide with SipW-like signal peptide